MHRPILCTACGEALDPHAPHPFNRLTLDRVHTGPCREVIELVQRDADDESNPWVLVEARAGERAA